MNDRPARQPDKRAPDLIAVNHDGLWSTLLGFDADTQGQLLQV